MSAAHIDDDALEAFSLGRLADGDVGPVEEHLLVCAECRHRLAGWDEYIVAMRKALRKMTQPAGRCSRDVASNRAKGYR